MSTLARTQREFVAALYSEAPCEPGIEAYRRNMLANLGNALGATYPVVKRLVGDAFFNEAARRYVRAEPSRSGDLNEYGGGFASFLAAYPYARELEYLPDVARLEWACHESYHAAGAVPFDAAALAAVAPESYEGLRFVLHPALRLVASPHAVVEIWEANQPQRDGTPSRTEGPDHAVVSRAGELVHVRLASPVEWKFLSALARGATLGEAAQALGEAHAQAFLAAGLARLVGEGAIAGFELASRA
ncbi:MAG TPA: DNA-binding domain-containing protein [Usitatibacter sp.]|nr:DNA-binding domain-containing protein [Usitatibacter sp.]